jgi:hypothetical protein
MYAYNKVVPKECCGLGGKDPRIHNLEISHQLWNPAVFTPE